MVKYVITKTKTVVRNMDKDKIIDETLAKIEQQEKKKQVIDTDKLKGRHKSDEDKAETRRVKNRYIAEYVQTNYKRIGLYLTAPEKTALHIQAELSNMTMSAYLKMLIKKDRANFDDAEYDAMLKKISEVVNIDEPIMRDKSKERANRIEEVKKQAEEHFKKSIYNVPKKQRCEYIYEHIKDEESGGFGSKQIYCQALDISRTLFYKFVRDKEKTEK